MMVTSEPEGLAASRLWRWLRIVALSLGLVVVASLAAGFVTAWVDHGDPLDAKSISIFAAIIVALAGLAWLTLREVRRPTGEEPLTRKERLNRNILIGCGLLGGLTAIMMTFAEPSGFKGDNIFSNEPLPTAIAVVLVLIMAVVLPIISYFWHRTVDEQEADAYKTGSLYAFYVYSIGAPVWWIAWRGGFAPEPSGILIYFAVMLTVLIVWTWKKYG